jgi:hypothetical protein
MAAVAPSLQQQSHRAEGERPMAASVQKSRKRWIPVLVAAVAALSFSPVVLADDTLGDGDGALPFAQSTLDFGDVCQGATYNDTVLVAMSRVSAFPDPARIFGNEEEVTVSLSPTHPYLNGSTMSDSSIVLPSDWTSQAVGSIHTGDTAEIAVVLDIPLAAPLGPSGTQTLDLTSTGDNYEGNPITRTIADAKAIWNVVECLDPGECAGADASLVGWTDIRRDLDINVGPDLGDGGDTAMNFTGSTGSAGDLWMTLYPGGTGYTNFSLCADVLTKPFNNRKGAGVLFLYNAGSGKGLAAIVTNAGNTDILLFGVADANTGSFSVLKSISLGAAIAEKAWYRLWVDVSFGAGPSVYVDAKVFRHEDPTDPYSDLGTQVGGDFDLFDGPPPAGILTSGDIGLVAYAKLAVVDSSATRFNYDLNYNGN